MHRKTSFGELLEPEIRLELPKNMGGRGESGMAPSGHSLDRRAFDHTEPGCRTWMDNCFPPRMRGATLAMFPPIQRVGRIGLQFA